LELYEKLKSRKFIIAGPCVIESESLVMSVAEEVKKLSEKLDFEFIFKASFDKANRTSIDSFRGFGMEEGLKILQKVKSEFNLPLTTDIHESYQAKPVGEVVDILQIPAFLSRQTDLLVESAKTDRIVNIKKAQFLSGTDMRNPVKKVEESGNRKIMLTERGNMFGYGNLVVDFRNILDMKELGYPVILDVTHSTQKPGGLGDKSGGDRKYAPHLAKVGKALDVDGWFFETHPDPEKALSDGANMIYLSKFESILRELL